MRYAVLMAAVLYAGMASAEPLTNELFFAIDKWASLTAADAHQLVARFKGHNKNGYLSFNALKILSPPAAKALAEFEGAGLIFRPAGSWTLPSFAAGRSISAPTQSPVIRG